MPCVKRDHPITVQTADGKPMEGAGDKHSEEVILRFATLQEELTWEISRLEDGIDGYLPICWLQHYNPDVQWNTGKMTWCSDYCKKHCLPMTAKDAARGFNQMSVERKEWISSYCRAVSASQVWQNEKGGDVSDDLPNHYREWVSVFNEEEINKFPEHTSWNHEIKLIEGSTPPYGPIYPLNEKKHSLLREYINKILAAGKIRISKSSAGSPILFVPEADGTLCRCVEYRGQNIITVQDRTPLPQMTELREHVAQARIFIKLDLRHGYNLIRKAEGDEWKTAFKTKYGLFEYFVMPFGLYNAPDSFQPMINEVLRGLLDEGVIVYIDDILIYSETEEEHIRLVSKVLEKLKKANL